LTKTLGAGVEGPIDAHQRIEVVDMIRGFALFGVLLVNMYNFGAYSPIWTGAGDRVAFGLMHLFFETKSWRLFALLFGLGFSLQLVRADARGAKFASVYVRRLVVLFGIGAAHALLFPGDVLMVYAELGLLLMLFRNAAPRLLLVAAIALLAVYPLGRAANSMVSGDDASATAVVDLERARALNEELRTTHPHAVGSVSEVLRANARVIPPNPFGRPLGLESGLGFFAMFLLGLHLGKRGIFSDVDAHLGLFRRAAVWGLSIGLIGMVVERTTSFVLEPTPTGGGTRPVLALLEDLAFTYGSTALALGYAASIVLLARSGRFRGLVEPLGPVGRLALTGYVTQTLVFTTIFYGYGLGQAFRLGPLAVTAMAVVIFAAQIVASSWWMRRFRLGPLEWLWRALTYLRIPPMRGATDEA
jgi:uncharacterized protein